MSANRFDDEPPSSHDLTKYDRTHLKLYLRLIDADADGAHWQEVVQILFEIDPNVDPDRARHIYDTHLARARWMTAHGYRHLVREGRR